MDVSATRFGQFLHDHVGRDFDLVDIDWQCYSVETKILRIFEEKHPGQDWREKPSQRRALPRWAQMIEVAVRRGELARGSGVYVVWLDRQAVLVHALRRIRIDGAESGSLIATPQPVAALKDFFRCRKLLPEPDEAGPPNEFQHALADGSGQWCCDFDHKDAWKWRQAQSFLVCERCWPSR